jgi:hypothetical protein
MKRFLWIFIAMLLFWVGLGYFIFCQLRLRDVFEQTRDRLISVASNAVLTIDPQRVLEVPLEETGDSSLAYQEIYDRLRAVKQANPFLKYVYIMAATDKPGILQYVVDANPAPQVITAKTPRALPGDKYDASAFPEMLRAYNGATADKKITADEWGVFLSGYAPIRDSGGKTLAILGVDVDAAGISVLQKKAQNSSLLVLAGFFIFLISLFATLIFKSKDTASE